MTLGDKFRFLADRAEDGKSFLWDDIVYAFGNNVLQMENSVITIEINNMKSADLKLKSTWEFTEDEKAILRNLKDRWRWIARDGDGSLRLFCVEPEKLDTLWVTPRCDFTPFRCFDHLFQSVQWKDDEPCEFRKYI